MTWFAIGTYWLVLILGFSVFSRFELWRAGLNHKRYLKKLRDEYTLRVIRDAVRNRRYRPNKGQRDEYKSLFRVCPFAANVYLVLLEVGEGNTVVLPKDEREKVLLLEHLVDIRFFNPYQYNLEDKKK